MKKKLFKYIKFLVSLTLILSLVAPSYASLSASDGSAFVTKAEFDSALADFNARLTTFEAGINSKIDSQVTSYLDRNGIWSPKDQIRVSPWNVAANEIDVKTTNQWMKNFSNRNTDMGNFLVFKSHQDTLRCVSLLVDDITKSGLCFVDYYVWHWDISCGNGFVTAPGATDYIHNGDFDTASGYGWTGNLTYAFYEDANLQEIANINPKYADCKGHVVQRVEYQGRQLAESAYLSSTYIIAQKSQGTVNFFVSKRSRLYLVMFVYGGGGRHSLTAWVATSWEATNNTSGIPKGPSCNIARVCVY